MFAKGDVEQNFWFLWDRFHYTQRIKSLRMFGENCNAYIYMDKQDGQDVNKKSWKQYCPYSLIALKAQPINILAVSSYFDPLSLILSIL